MIRGKAESMLLKGEWLSELVERLQQRKEGDAKEQQRSRMGVMLQQLQSAWERLPTVA